MTTEEKKKNGKKKRGKKKIIIMMKIVATNVVASRPPERQGSPATTIARAKNLEGGGSQLWALVPWTIGSLHTKSWPPTMPVALKKVLGGWFLQQI